MSAGRVTRCDLHLHSSASVDSGEWFSRRFNCPESYASPARQYELCKQRGMDLVTLTDHDTVEGGLELTDRSDFFLSEEVTARLPDGTIVHVLTWALRSDHHDQLQARARDVRRLVEYLRAEKIAHALAHPLLSPNWKLDADKLELLLALFPVLEGVNGLLDARIRDDLAEILDGWGPVAGRVAAAHGIADPPSRHVLVGGSDDHCHRRAATAFTEADGAGLDAAGFLDAVGRGEVRPCGEQADLTAIALGVSHTTYSFLRERGEQRPGYEDPFVDMVDVLAGRRDAAGGSASPAAGFIQSLVAGAAKAELPIGPGLDLTRVEAATSVDADRQIADGVARLNDAMIDTAIGELIAAIGDVDMYRLFGAVQDLGGAVTTALPFLFAADHFGRQHAQVRRVRAEWTATPLAPTEERLALFSDSIAHTDGVSRSCKRFVAQAHAAGKAAFIPHCGEPGAGDASWFRRIPGVRTIRSRLYPSLAFDVPSLLGTVDWMWRERITRVELATPGPMGLVGMIAARLMRVPMTASYHTEVPALLLALSGSSLLHGAVHHYLSWFYAAVDKVIVFSEGSRGRLAQFGVPPEKIEAVPVAVDPHEFTPRRVDRSVFAAVDVAVGDRPVVLSVGRLSPEKNLDLVIDAVGRLQHLDHAPILVIVGDGPDRERLVQRAHGLPWVRFVGEQRGETLGRLYASASVFAFASQIDTLGLVALEAMASGLPVVVPACANIAAMVAGRGVGECYEFGAEGLASAIARVLGDRDRARRLGRNAREAMVTRWAQARFEHHWRTMTGG
jgi:glycosyltransferase involved in cell wall biosynthesis